MAPTVEEMLTRFSEDDSVSDINIDSNDIQRIFDWVRNTFPDQSVPVDQPPPPPPPRHSEPVQYTQEEKQQINDWCKIANILFNLIKQAPDCPIALLRLIHSIGVENAVHVTDQRGDLFLPIQDLAEGTNMQLCGLLNALNAPKHKPRDFGIAWMVGLALGIRTFDLHKRGLRLNSSQSEAREVQAFNEASGNALDSKLREKSSRQLITLVNRALHCLCAITPNDFFGVPLLAYMGFNRKMLSSMTEGAMSIFMDVFTKPIKSLEEILPSILVNQRVWRSVYIPILDFIVMTLIPLLSKREFFSLYSIRDIHNRSVLTGFDTLPSALKQLLPLASGGQTFSTRLQLPQLSFSGNLQSSTAPPFQMPSDELIDDRYIALHNQKGQSASVADFAGEIRLRNGKSRLSVDWNEQRNQLWQDVSHARNYHHFAVLLKIFNEIAKENAIEDFLHTSGEFITREILEEAEYDIRERKTRHLLVSEGEGEIAFGHDHVPIPPVKLWPFDHTAWQELLPRYQACFRMFTPGVEPTDDDTKRIDQGINLLQEQNSILSAEDDRDLLLKVLIQVAVEHITIHAGILDGTKTISELWCSQNPPLPRQEDASEIYE
ncbi:uncharacterized protein FA14DRAFT_171727 [Meira miltonrushii]|uniref:Uncharacterized protein n=1 Tax=Meira miltonrushii TaxID=1280837 RepID=A0A316VBU0_9BASI|nr:uncharacterized protein FA14DRAFT_171727 [Meira miltonrushii]PWN35032.1 hypothetical protein FA14DRAFT_171727 [Meira miltonrushii]